VKPYALPADARITVSFVDDLEMRGLNKRFRHMDRTTDVLSFGQAIAPAKGERAVKRLARDADGALKRRTIVIECEHRISDEADVKDWAGKLVDEEAEAIMADLIACRQGYLQEGKLYIPEQLIANRGAYFDQGDKIAIFFSEECEADADFKVLKHEVYARDKDGVRAAGCKPLGRTWFYARVEAHGVSQKYSITPDLKRMEAGCGAPKGGVYVGMKLVELEHSTSF